MKLTLLLVFFMFLFIANAQVENADKSNAFIGEQKYYIDFLNFKGKEKDKTRLDVFVQVPYKIIQFVKSENEFVGNYNVTISVFDEDKNTLFVEKSWTEKLESQKFEQTISKDNYNLSLRSFELMPDKYLIRSIVEDQDSKNEYKYENLVNVRDFSKLPAVSDVMLISKETMVKGETKILPNVSRNVVAKKEGLPFFFEVYTDSAGSVKIEYAIKDKKDIIFDTTETKKIDSSHIQVFSKIKDQDLSLGSYELVVSLENYDGDVLAVSSKPFLSRWIGIPSSVKDLDKAIDQLVYIASSSEISNMEDAKTKDDKIKLYLAFWKKKDPTPNTEENEVRDEYYRRIAYANQNFSHYIEGWKSDRGMVFIILGPPNNVDRHPFEYDSKPYEVWEYYNLSKDFVFVDETGFGDYRLVTPMYGDFYHYRQ